MNAKPFAALLLVVCFATALVARGQDEDKSLVLHFTFDRDEGAVAKDLSAYGNDGKITAAQHFAEVDGRQGVLRFDGKEARIDCGDAESLRLSGDMTLEMWVRQNAPITTTGAYLFRRASDFYFMVEGYASLLIVYRNGLDRAPLPVQRSVFGEAWSHVAVVIEYPRCRFYRDGVLVRDAFMPISGVAMPGKGGPQIGVTCPMDLDELRLYRRALTPAEVAAHAKGLDAPRNAHAELAVEPDWYRNMATLRVSCTGLPGRGREVEFQLQITGDAQSLPPKKAALTEAFPGCGRYVTSATFPLDGLEGKTATGVAAFLGVDAKPLPSLRREIILDKPDWINTREGYSDDVLPPWTPVQAEVNAAGDVQVAVWGRRYVFGRTPLLQKIESAGSDLLTDPIAITARADDQPIVWKDGRVALSRTSKTAAVVEQVFEHDRATLKVVATTEFDGFTTYECEVLARRNLAWEALTLDIPLRTAHAAFCYADFAYPDDPKAPMKRNQCGAIAGDMAIQFSPNVWIGDDARGVCWQAESDEDWRHANPQKAMEILPLGDTTTLRANLISAPLRVAAGRVLRYKFALLATPVKPMLRDSWDLRIARSEPYGADLNLPDRMIDGKPALQRYAEMGIRHLFINVNEVWPYPMPLHETFATALRRTVKAAQAHGVRPYPYVIHERFPTTVPEFEGYGSDMASRPMRSYVQNAEPDPESPRPGPLSVKYGADSQGTVQFCARSRALQDACIHSLARRLDEFGDDGVYLDGTSAHIKPCSNLLHGCGYRAEDGTLRSTYPVFANREFIRRIYTVVRQRKPEGLVDLHSWCTNAACFAYADMLWTGEQWYHLRQTGAKYIAGELTLDMFRTSFTGRPIGIAAETLAYRLGPPMKVAATSLLHDVPVRPSTGQEYCDIIAALWKVRDAFGAKEAEKLFYWKNAEYATVTPEKCYTTLFKHPKNGVLAFVSNLTPESQKVTVAFNKEKLGLAGRKLDVFNVLTREPVALDAGGRMTVALRSEEWLYVWLKPDGD